MKKKSKFYKNYMNRKIIQTYTVETLQLFPLCLWTMLQHVKVGHIALSQMVIFIFGLKTPHLIYLGPTCTVHVRLTVQVHVSIVRFESGKKATFWNPPPPCGDLVG